MLALGACASDRVTGREEAAQQPPVEEEAEPEPPEVEPEEPEAPPPPYTQVEEIRVALLLPLSGQHESVGQSLLNAAQMALFDLGDDRFMLLVKDTRGTPRGAAEAAEQALAEGASLIVGPLFAESVLGAAPVLQESGINLIAFSNDRSVAGPGRYVMGLLPSAQVVRVVDYAARQGYRRLAALAPRSPYGDTVIQALQDAVRRTGTELVRVVVYPEGETDISAQVRLLGDYDNRRRELERQRAVLKARDDEASKLALKRLENLDTLGEPGFDTLLLPEGRGQLRSIAPLLPFYDIDPETVKFLGTALWNDPTLGREPALRGGWFAAPPPETWNEFAGRYEALYGSWPPNVAGLSYDAVALAAVLARDAVPQDAPSAFGDLILTQPSGFAGVNGIFRFLPDGTVQRGLAVLELTDTGIREVEPAPGSFEQLVN